MSIPIDSATASLFRALSAVRGKRVFHPDGVGFSATLTTNAPAPTGARLFDDHTPRDAVVRLSRSAGLPVPLPDALGLSIRGADAYGHGRHQDFLLVTSSGRVVGRHLLLPAPGFLARPYSSLLPYRIASRLVVVGAMPGRDERNGPSLSELGDKGA